MVDKRSAPAYSIGNSTASFKAPSQLFPGPGSYETHTYINPTTHGANTKHGGTEQRFKQHQNIVPGPGHYSSQLHKDHIQTAIVASRAKEHRLEQGPGPGAYDPNYRKIVKADFGYKIGGAQKIADLAKNGSKSPGPGDYETNKSTVKQDHAIKIGTQRRSDMVLNHFTPGPGQYKDVNPQQVTLRHNPTIVFGKSGRSMSSSNLYPGPGSYALTDKFDESINKSKGFTMSSKHHEIPPFAEKVPGPGSYNTDELDKMRHKIVSFSIGKSQKLKIDNQKEIQTLPGPEKYSWNPHTFETKNTIFGKQKRPSLGQETIVPGPGAYSAKLQSTLPNFSIPKANSSWLRPSQTPGPGNYEPKITESSNYNNIKLGKDQRKPFYDEKKGVPGPGSYNSPPIQRAIGFKIGNQKRGPMKNDNNPGPGNYVIPSTISNVPKYNK